MTFKPCMSILPAIQQRLWPDLAPTKRLGFVLYGGTAIALRCGHRQSIDFDFFSDEPVNRESLLGSMPLLEKATVIQDQGQAFTLLVNYVDDVDSNVKVSFFGALKMGRVGTPEITEDHVIQVASLDDLMATKLKVILQRAEAKDYSDIDAMIENGISLSKGLSSARLIFGPNFQPSESLKALGYFKDGDLHSLSKATKERLVRAVSAVKDLPQVALLSPKLHVTTQTNK